MWKTLAFLIALIALLLLLAKGPTCCAKTSALIVRAMANLKLMRSRLVGRERDFDRLRS